MIKELITDVAFDKITVSQGLTRAKLIARQIKSDTFKNWLTKELNGYKYDDPILPDYRKIWAEIQLTAEFSFGRTQTFTVVLPDHRKDLESLLNFHHVIEPISIIEQNMNQLTKEIGYINLTGGQVQLVGDLYNSQLQKQGGVIRSGQRTIGKSQLSNIIELTKQKLIDTLQDLEEQFPDIDNKYILNSDNEKKISNIITNNIYGNNNPFNVLSGEQITQRDVNQTINAYQISKLTELGIEEEAINELKAIDIKNPKGSSERKSKIMSWLGRVTSSLSAKGIYDNTPKLIEFIGNLM